MKKIKITQSVLVGLSIHVTDRATYKAFEKWLRDSECRAYSMSKVGESTILMITDIITAELIKHKWARVSRKNMNKKIK